MHNNVYVTLQVLNEHYKQIKELICEEASEEYEFDDAKFILMHFEEVRYGELSGLSEVRNAGFPYDSSWTRGEDFSPGTEFCRYDDEGNCIVKSVYEDIENPNISDLLKLIDDPVKLRQLILDHKERNAVMSWSTQTYNSKIARTRALIGV